MPYYDPVVVFAPPRPGIAIAGAIHFGPESPSARHSAVGDGGLALDSCGLRIPSSSTAIPGAGYGLIGLFTCIHMYIRGCVRLDRVWRLIGSDDNHSVAWAEYRLMLADAYELRGQTSSFCLSTGFNLRHGDGSFRPL